MPASDASVVQVADVTVRYRDKILLDRISFEVNRGERLVLLGASGAGKSLLIDTLAGNIAFDGSVRFDPSLSRRQRTFSYDVFATLSLLKVSEVLRLLESIYGAPRHDGLVRRFHLAAMADKQVRVLSKGERKRIGVYAALFSDPLLAVLDEPTDGMDPILRDAFWEIIAERSGTTLLTTHLWEEAQTRSDRVLLIAQGRVIAPPAPVGELIRSLGFTGKVVTGEACLPPDGTVSIVSDQRRFSYFTDDTHRARLVDAAATVAGGYSVLPLDLVDVYLLRSRPTDAGDAR